MTRRIERVNHLLRLELSELLKCHIKDPRLSELVGITEVETSSDLKYARVFVSCICAEDEKREIMKAFASAAGFLRSEIAKRMKMRRVPELSFHWDDSIERGARISELMQQVKAERDAEA